MSKPRIVICTDFFGKFDSYSVSNVAFTEAESFVKLGYDVSMLVRHSYPKDHEVPGLKFIKAMPHPTKLDIDPNFATPGEEWKDWKDSAAEAQKVLQEHLEGFDVAITHDWILQNATIPWNWAMRRVNLPNLTWFHRLHSYPTGDRTPESEMNPFTALKSTVPENGRHYLAWANNGHALWLAERYWADLTKVEVIPLGVDWCQFFGMGKEAENIVTQMDAFNANLVQCYAFCSSRIQHKGVHYLLQMFGGFKALGQKVKLILCNANSVLEGKERPQLQELANLAKECGLREYEDFCFTSRLNKSYSAGVSRETVQQLNAISNVFIFPSETETYGLVALEAAATGAFTVLNEDLVPLKEVGGNYSMYLRWDSDHKNIRTTIHWEPNAREAMFQYARAIMPMVANNRVLQNKMRVLNEHHSTNIAKKYWEPLFYKHWVVPMSERGEADLEIKSIGAPGEKPKAPEKGEKIEKLDEKFVPQIGIPGVSPLPSSPSPPSDEEKGKEGTPLMSLQPPLTPEEWAGKGEEMSENKEEKPEEEKKKAEESKVIEIDMAKVPSKCSKCEGVIVIFATTKVPTCVKCGKEFRDE
jgi:glycosyltransferase involved in cell wall biosynthesis